MIREKEESDAIIYVRFYIYEYYYRYTRELANAIEASGGNLDFGGRRRCGAVWLSSHGFSARVCPLFGLVIARYVQSSVQ